MSLREFKKNPLLDINTYQLEWLQFLFYYFFVCVSIFYNFKLLTLPRSGKMLWCWNICNFMGKNVKFWNKPVKLIKVPEIIKNIFILQLSFISPSYLVKRNRIYFIFKFFTCFMCFKSSILSIDLTTVILTMWHWGGCLTILSFNFSIIKKLKTNRIHP